MTTTFDLSASVSSAPVAATARARAVAALFDLTVNASPMRRLFAPFTLAVKPATLTLITGPSGSGKSTLLAAIEAAAKTQGGVRAVRLEAIELPGDLPVVDCFGCSPERALEHLARAGLSEAHVLLRAPAELSEGQRFRYRLAQFFASDFDWLLADEFAATLDRVTAKIVAYQLGKFIRASAAGGRGKSAIVATTHEDLVMDLAPEVMVYKGLGEMLEVIAGRSQEPEVRNQKPEARSQ